MSGKFSRDTVFAADDHRLYNRKGESFDRGETFSGIDYETQLDAVEKLRIIIPRRMTMAQFALRWILMFDAVTAAIPGAKRVSQVEENIAAGDFPPIAATRMKQIQTLYTQLIRSHVHHYW